MLSVLTRLSIAIWRWRRAELWRLGFEVLQTRLGGWGFWGHVSLVRGVESSTWPWHRIGQGLPQPRVRVYVHIFRRRGSLSPSTCQILLAFPSV